MLTLDYDKLLVLTMMFVIKIAWSSLDGLILNNSDAYPKVKIRQCFNSIDNDVCDKR
jgi:hypothetical protein